MENIKSLILLKQILELKINGWYGTNYKKILIIWLCGWNGGIAYELYQNNKRKNKLKLKDFLILWAKCEKHNAEKIYNEELKKYEKPCYYDEIDDDCPEGNNHYTAMIRTIERIEKFLNTPCSKYYDLAYKLGKKAEKTISHYKKLNEKIKTILDKADLEKNLTNNFYFDYMVGKKRYDAKLIEGGALSTWFASVKKSKGVFKDTLRIMLEWYTYDNRVVKTSYSQEWLEKFYKYIVSKNATRLINEKIQKSKKPFIIYSTKNKGGEVKEVELYFEDLKEQLLITFKNGEKLKFNIRFEWILEKFFK